MGVINATQYKTTSSGPGLISRFMGWVEGLFGAPAATAPAAHGEGDSPSPDFPNEMEFGCDKTGGWDKAKTAGWSPHGDEGIE